MVNTASYLGGVLFQNTQRRELLCRCPLLLKGLNRAITSTNIFITTSFVRADLALKMRVKQYSGSKG